MGPETTRLARIDPGASQTFGVLSALLTAVGAVLVVVAFTTLHWFSGDTGSGPSSTFSNIHKVLDGAGKFAEGPAKLYFSWLGWVLLAAAALTALIAAAPTVGRPFRVVGTLIAVAGIVATFFAIKLAKTSALDRGYIDYLKHARFGFYFAVGGFLLIGVGAIIGPSSKRR